MDGWTDGRMSAANVKKVLKRTKRVLLISVLAFLVACAASGDNASTHTHEQSLSESEPPEASSDQQSPPAMAFVPGRTRDGGAVPEEWLRCTEPSDCVLIGGCCPCSLAGYTAYNRHFQEQMRGFQPDCPSSGCRMPTGDICVTPRSTCPLGGGLCSVVDQ